MKQTVIVIDFGGQYSQLIARKIREAGVYCEVVPWTEETGRILARKPIGIVLSGGPASVYEQDAPRVERRLLEAGVPVLGICYGCQLIVRLLGGSVSAAQAERAREYGRTRTRFDGSCPLFAALPPEGSVWMSHSDFVDALPEGFTVCAVTEHCPNAAICDTKRQLYGLQFHPEVRHTEHGQEILRRFLYEICGAAGGWNMSSFRQQSVDEIRRTVGDGRVLLALSGGVDSAVAAALIGQAIGSRLTCVYVDHGLMRKGESEEIEAYYSRLELRFRRVDAGARFLAALAGVTEPEQKRRIIGREFIEVFAEEAGRLGEIEYLAQGTIYPDVIESGAAGGQVIKSHHNVGGLPEQIGFRGIIEPLRLLFKDEVRALGRELGLPERIVGRQPFPGPGLAVRVLGEVTAEKLALLREADAIFREAVEEAGLDQSIAQYFAVLTGMRTVGVMGDVRSYQHTVALRAVCTEDFMTADFARIPYEVLEKASRRIVNEVSGVNRVVYDITSKPPATVEYE
ncbi:MAG: glutamine-hydrolyzing GMP synthase [Firmicutes bacterium]|nr:glutamine-hydrolyzing GMP synthase [Bacillota bacterium]